MVIFFCLLLKNNCFETIALKQYGKVDNELYDRVHSRINGIKYTVEYIIEYIDKYKRNIWTS